MRSLKIGVALLAVALSADSLLGAGQAIVLKQNLSQMVAAAERIYRGTVLSAEEVTVEIGGGQIPATSYQIGVTEHFKGDVDLQKDDQAVVELKMVGNTKPVLRVEGDLAVLPVLPEMPRLAVGGDYLLLTNAANANGLAATIGLAQGSFQISGEGKVETAVNGLNNAGLFAGMVGDFPAEGPISYDTLAAAIRAELGQ